MLGRQHLGSPLPAAAAALALAAALSATAQEQATVPPGPHETLATEALHPGMRGVGFTVVRGTQPEPFDVEILGLLGQAFPKQDLIVARLTGLGLERSGVVAGMSGSPVFIDDRLIGAVAYRLVSAGHEAIAGIIPIDSMLQVAALGTAPPAGVTASPGDPGTLLTAASELAVGAAPSGSLASLRAAVPGVSPIATPVAVSGLSPTLVARLEPLFDALGWAPTLGGGSAAQAIEPNVGPGGVVAVQLVRGDLEITASGTVTWSDGDRLLAFGHPFLQGGNVDYPLVGAEVITILSSRQVSSKLTAHGREILGAIRQDRTPGILGALGARPRMVPVTARIERRGRTAEPLRFEIVSDRNLTPLYLFFGLVNAIQSLDQVSNQDAIAVRGQITLGAGLEPIRLDNVYSSQGQAIVSLGSTLAGIFSFLYTNDLGLIPLESVDLTLTLMSERRTATIEHAWVDPVQARPGQEVVVAVQLRPYREATRIERFRFVVDEDAVQGQSLRVLVGDAGAADGADPEMLGPAQRPRDSAQAVRLLNRARRNDRLYMQVSRSASGFVLEGRLLASLPPSRRAVLESPRATGALERVDRRLVLERSLDLPYAVSGSRQLELEVISR